MKYLLDTSIIAFLFRKSYNIGNRLRELDSDLLIGCTAVANNMIMVTDNIKHFSRIYGIQLENWVNR